MDEHFENTMNRKKRIIKQRALTLLEVIVAIFVIIIGITGALSLINYTISGVLVGKSQIIAVNLAQEGLEIVRNIRDSNWIQNIAWNIGLATGEYQAQYNSDDLLSLAGNPVIKINSNGFYQYDVGTNTHFHRKITITSANEIKVISEVTWSERGRSFSVSAEDRLYDWK